MTDTTVLQPAPGQTVVTTETGHHHNHNRHHDFDSVEARADFRSLTNEVERFGTANLASASRTNEIVQAGNCRTDSIVQAGFGDTSDRICASTKDVTAALSAGFTADALAACKISDQVAEAKLQTAIGFKDSIIANNVGFSAATVQAATIGSAAQVLATAFANQAQNTATQNYNGTTVQVERVRAELALAQTTGFAAAALLATQLDAQARREAAACCCELKEKITAEGVATRALINEVEARRVQVELQRLQTQVAVLTGGVIGSAARAA